MMRRADRAIVCPWVFGRGYGAGEGVEFYKDKGELQKALGETLRAWRKEAEQEREEVREKKRLRPRCWSLLVLRDLNPEWRKKLC